MQPSFSSSDESNKIVSFGLDLVFLAGFITFLILYLTKSTNLPIVPVQT
jgi:hypothetical protein